MVVKVKETRITDELRKRLKLPSWIDGYETIVGKVISYNTKYGYDWKELETKKFQNDVSRIEKAGFTCVVINSDDDNYLVAVKGPLDKMTDAQCKALFGTNDFQRADRMD